MSSELQRDAGSLRYSKLCLEVLLHNKYNTFSFNGQSTFASFLTQFSSTNVAVSTALATFGAIYEAIILQRTQSGLSLTSIQYCKALAALHKDVALQSHGPIPSFLASLVLAAAHALQRHYTDSLTHLHGAFTVLTNSITPRIQDSSETSPASSNSSISMVMNTYQSELYSFAQSIDLHTATYVLHRPPELPSFFDAATLNQSWDPTFLETACHVLQQLLHRCYHVANAVSHYKYLPRSRFPADLMLEQGRCIAYLSQWLAKCDDGFRDRPLSWTQSSCRQTYLVHRVQCLSTLIHLSSVSSPYEMNYDIYTTYFEQIIRNADEVLGSSSFGSSQSSTSSFRVQPGLAQALFFTSLEFRDGVQRRRAIELLSKLGMEGPWNPDILCRIARRAVEIEESNALSASSMEEYVHAPLKVEIPEKFRLHGCGIDSEAGDLEANKNGTVNFSLCVDVDYMVNSEDHENHRHWIIWAEPIALSLPGMET
ncbi:hypothetical protein LTR84_009483 [Exophiala bonariae]|uniref:Transcription factor domain-containing protein n=1 Tax=Exophiala bonariae TaxID=1690606 RepID=A0AAV9MWR6_9EURO|nr:hypothetical protein LTR84_009483 [Exophiala bonariae]